MSDSSPTESGGNDRRQRIHFGGRVQGVGFRARTLSVARRYPITGFVQNLADGRVLVVAEGAEAALGQFLRDVERTMDGYIRSCDVLVQDATGEFADFSIRYQA